MQSRPLSMDFPRKPNRQTFDESSPGQLQRASACATCPKTSRLVWMFVNNNCSIGTNSAFGCNYGAASSPSQTSAVGTTGFLRSVQVHAVRFTRSPQTTGHAHQNKPKESGQHMLQTHKSALVFESALVVARYA